MRTIANFCRTARRTEILGISIDLLDFLEKLLQCALIGKVATGEEEHDQFVRHLSAFFRRHSALLIQTLKQMVEQNPSMRKVIVASMLNISEVNRQMLKQQVSMKFGGKIPDKRWKICFVPMLRQTVKRETQKRRVGANGCPTLYSTMRAAKFSRAYTVCRR